MQNQLAKLMLSDAINEGDKIKIYVSNLTINKMHLYINTIYLIFLF
ncbi:hypothetical protein [Neoehrlichia mikurensis]